MKFALIALFLSCTAVICGFAMQSDLSPSEPPAVALLPQIGSTLERLWLGLPFHHAAGAPVPSPDDAKANLAAPSIPLLTKTETLLLIAEAAVRHRVPAAFVTSIVAAESNFDCAAISPRGAVGLMQLMPATASRFGVSNPYDAQQNVHAGARYLKFLIDRFGHDIRLALAAYNAGEDAVARNGGQIPPFSETMAYVPRVLKIYRMLGEQPRAT
jgi:soluble lytic murein transglycosylase-like protein